MITSMLRVFHAGPQCRDNRPLPWMNRVARRWLASSGALAGLVALVGSAALPASAAGQDDFACGADQVEVSFGLTGEVEQWEVPAGVDSVRVIAAGGRGGDDHAPGGAGALVAGTFPVTPEATLHIIVAGQAALGVPGGGGGGGGSFVGVGGFSYDEGELLLVAGGGGGAGGDVSGGNAGLPGSDGDPGDGPGGGQGGGSDGVGGTGGCDVSTCGGDGGGASEGSDGADGDRAGGGAGAGGNGGGFDPSLAPAMAAINGGAGGEGLLDANGGGFGGGGGGGDFAGAGGGGGGGGFAGGGGGSFAGGGGGGSSFVAASVEDEASAPYTGGDGFVTLCYEGSPPSFSKSFSPASIVPGETSTLTFTIDNTGSPAEAGELAFIDPLPAGVAVADPANASTECGGTLTATAGSTEITYEGGTVEAGATCTLTVDVTSTVPGSHENVSGVLTSSQGDSGEAMATLEVSEVATSFTVETATGTGEATGTIDGGGAGCAVSATALAVGDVATPPPPGVTLPHGLFALALTGCEAGASVEVTLNLPPEVPLGSEYWKYGPTPDQGEPHWYTLESAAISGSTVTFTLVDGGAGDGDLAANGTIIDPGGPAGVPPVPALPRVARFLLLTLLAWAAFRTLHR